HEVGYLWFEVLAGFATVLVAAFVLRGRSPVPVLTMALIGTTVSAVVAVATFENPAQGPLARLVAPTDIGVRARGPFSNPNYMGMFAAAVLIAILAIWSGVRSRAARSLLLVIVGLLVVSIVEAQSRGAIVAAFAGIAALAWLRSRR